MKRFIAVTLACILCISLTSAAFADSNVTIAIGGDVTGSDININSIDGCNNNAIINDGATGCVRPGTSTCVVINGVPSCVEPANHCGPDPDYCARMRRHTCLKNYARDVWGYLEGRLRSIGWWHKNYKFIWSFETRVIYGSRGDNNHYRDRLPVTFYCKSDPSTKVKAYLSVYKKGKNYMTLFSWDFTPAKKCSNKGYVYSDDLMITGAYEDGYEAVDEFIEYLQSLSGDVEDDEDYEVDE